jgi:CRISP-associated protein Cas1
VLKGRLGLESARIPQADRHGLVWLSRGKLVAEDGTLHFITTGYEDLPQGDYTLPFQMISCILMGPGGSVTHDALRLLARHGTGLVAVGEGGVRMYASMPFGPDASALARRQVEAWSDKDGQRIAVVRRMYAWRLGELLPAWDLAALRGIEGARVKESYRRLAQQYGIAWDGRHYDRQNPAATNLANMAINHASIAVEAAAMTAVATVGALPQIGFIHEDSGLSFCLDVADLFRETITLPAAFAGVREAEKSGTAPLERCVRKIAGRMIRDKKVIPGMIDRIKELFDDCSRHS